MSVQRPSSKAHANTSVLVKTMKTLLQGGVYDNELIGSIEYIKILAKKTKEQASQCMQERLCGVDQTVVRVDKNVIRMDEKVEVLCQTLYRLLQSNPLVDRRTGQGMDSRGFKLIFATDHD